MRVDPIYIRVNGSPPRLVRTTSMTFGDEVEISKQVLEDADRTLIRLYGDQLRVRNGYGWDQYREVDHDTRRMTRLYVFEEIVEDHGA